MFWAIFEKNGSEYAIKWIQIDKSNTQILKEIMMLKDLDHPNIIKLHTWFVENDNLYLVLELASGGDLLKLIDA